MSTTTYKAIRDNMITLVEALAPTSLSSTKFRRYRSPQDFRAWAEAHPAASLRQFDIRDVSAHAPPPVSNTLVEEEEATAELAVAYPHEWSKYGPKYGLSLEDVMDQDRRAIESEIGIRGYGNYVAGQSLCETDSSPEWGAKVSFLVFTCHLTYYRSVA